MAITPAFSIKTSTGRSPHRLAKALTEPRSPRSSCDTSTEPLIFAAAALPLAGSRTASTTLAPISARLFAVAKPSPLFAPVCRNARGESSSLRWRVD